MPAKQVPAASPSSLAQMAKEVQAQISSARDRLAETRARLDSVLAERERILSAPTAPEDVRGILVANIRRRAIEAQAEVDQLLKELHKQAASAETAHGSDAALYGVPGGKVSIDLLCAILPAETIADAMLKLSSVKPSADAGLPVAARRAKVQELDAQADLLRGEIADLTSALEAAGVTVDTTPAEKAPSGEDAYQWTSHGWIRNEDMAA
ncbi:hypothetical protein [Thiocapsa bogorovii]|uniref:hypothetical protein n=1 Tax=Thiocapsa bogorovii TaxID=521689 RepID=UPI001E37056F|nr:hypothetical protein [Thiocapsa bogorovii]UHD15722.1 hypothetical protein LT988_21075 [Thiocapsa bogorovii]